MVRFCVKHYARMKETKTTIETAFIIAKDTMELSWKIKLFMKTYIGGWCDTSPRWFFPEFPSRSFHNISIVFREDAQYVFKL